MRAARPAAFAAVDHNPLAATIPPIAGTGIGETVTGGGLRRLREAARTERALWRPIASENSILGLLDGARRRGRAVIAAGKGRADALAAMNEANDTGPTLHPVAIAAVDHLI